MPTVFLKSDVGPLRSATRNPGIGHSLRISRTWDGVLAGFVRVKTATTGLALVSMIVLAFRAGLPTEPVMSVTFHTGMAGP